MFLTVYDRERLHNIHHVAVVRDDESYTVEIFIGLERGTQSFYIMAKTADRYRSLLHLCINSIEELIKIEEMSKILNKTLYKSWRGFIMTLQDRVTSIDCEMITDLGFVLDMVSLYSKGKYIDYVDYMKYTRVKNNGSYFILTNLKQVGNKVQIETNTDQVLIIQKVKQESSVLRILNKMVTNEKDLVTNDDLIDYLISEEFEQLNIKEGVLTLQGLKDRLFIQKGLVVSIAINQVETNKIAKTH